MQFIRVNFDEDDSTDMLNRQHLLGMRAGLYSGFDKDASTAGLTLVLSHADSGYKEVNADLTQTPFLGSIKTQQGVHIYEDAAVPITVVNNAANGNPRIDLIVVEHEYTAISGGTSAGYVVIQGIPNATPVAPALTFPLKQVIIGRIYWPANAATLTATGVVYTKEPTPAFAGDPSVIRTIGNQSITGRKEFQFTTGVINPMTLNTSTNVLSASIASNYYELAYVGPNFEDVDSFSFPYVGGAIPITVLTNQRLRINGGAQIMFQNGRTEMSLEIGESFTILDITNSVTTGATNVYLVLNGGDVHRDGITKMFGQLLLNKGAATISNVNGGVTLDGAGNYYQVSFDFNATNILTILGSDPYADPLLSVTKGGNIICIRLTNTGTAGATTDVTHGATVSVPDHKPISNPTGNSIPVLDGAILFLIEDETEYRIIDIVDSRLSTPALYDAINAVVQNRETQWTKIQSDGWKDLGTVALNSSGHLILTDEGNHFQCTVDPFDATAIAMTDIKIQRGAAPPVAAPAGLEVSVRFVHTIPIIGIETFKIDLGNSSNIRSEVSDENLAGIIPSVSYHLIAGLYGVEGQVIRFRKSNTKWDIVSISDDARTGSRVTTLQTQVGALIALPTWIAFTGVTYGSGFSASTPAPRYFKSSNGRVQLGGNIGYVGGASTNPIICTLPVGFRPSRIHNFAIQGGDTTTNWVAAVSISTTGVVTLIGSVISGVTYALDQVSFYTN